MKSADYKQIYINILKKKKINNTYNLFNLK